MEEVAELLYADAKAEPTRIPYFLHIDPNKPGCFVLSWIVSQSSSPLKSMYIAVLNDVSVFLSLYHCIIVKILNWILFYICQCV